MKRDKMRNTGQIRKFTNKRTIIRTFTKMGGSRRRDNSEIKCNWGLI